MNVTSIEWTTFSANPLKYRDAAGKVVWGCVHASPGCQHCYSETRAKRYDRGGPFNVPTMNGLTPFLDDAELRKMLTAKTVGGIPVSGSRCFVGDMTDIFGDWVPDELLDRLFAVFALRPDVTFQVLTKRAERTREYVSTRNGHSSGVWFAAEKLRPSPPRRHWYHAPRSFSWPLPNVWLGVSCENQQYADERIPLLLQTPAAVRWVSAEPLLGPIDFTSLDPEGYYAAMQAHGFSAIWRNNPFRPCLDWVVVGGESGPGARPCDLAWIRSIVQQCQNADVPVFVKQLGAHLIDRNDAGFEGDPGDSWGPETRYEELTPQGWQGDPVRIRLRDRKGGDITEFPADLRVREYPRVEVHA